MSDTPSAKSQSQSMWGGRFSAKPADIMQAINVSIGVDKRLWAQDLAGSRAHCRMLAKQGIIQQADADAILGGLDVIEGEIKDGTFPFRDAYEDIHMNVEARLNELIGEPSGRLHTAGDAGPPPDGLCRNVRPRCLALCRRPCPNERKPAGRCRFGRFALPD